MRMQCAVPFFRLFSASAGAARLADRSIILAALNAIAVAGERACEQGYDCSQTAGSAPRYHHGAK